MWFCYDGCSFDTYETQEEAKAAAEKAFEHYEDNAADGWSEEAHQVCWGKVLVHAQVTEERPATEEEKEWAEWDTHQVIELVECDVAKLDQPSVEWSHLGCSVRLRNILCDNGVKTIEQAAEIAAGNVRLKGLGIVLRNELQGIVANELLESWGFRPVYDE